MWMPLSYYVLKLPSQNLRPKVLCEILLSLGFSLPHRLNFNWRVAVCFLMVNDINYYCESEDKTSVSNIR